MNEKQKPGAKSTKYMIKPTALFMTSVINPILSQIYKAIFKT